MKPVCLIVCLYDEIELFQRAFASVKKGLNGLQILRPDWRWSASYEFLNLMTLDDLLGRGRLKKSRLFRGPAY